MGPYSDGPLPSGADRVFEGESLLVVHTDVVGRGSGV